MIPGISRRAAIRSGAVAGLSLFHGSVSRKSLGGESPNEKLNLACIGVGGRGSANVRGVASQNLVAFVDVDEKRAAASYSAHPNTRRYTDFRKLFDEMGSGLDGVVISTPDHSHFHPAYAAMQLGLHVYLEKPLAHNIWETRQLTDLARKKKLATQLGAQRHAMQNMHRVVELIQGDAIGRVREVHSWIGGNRGMPNVPNDHPSVPAGLDYDLWVGPARYREYHPSFCPYGWRFWWDYGTGETGNWGCHILDIPFWALGLKYPSRVDATGPPIDSDRTPKSMQVTYRFDETAQGGSVDLHWYHGKPEILEKHDLPDKGNNTLFIGEHGMLLCGFSKRVLLPEESFADFKAPDPSLPDSPGFHNEWINACKGGTPATCNFEYSGPLAETVLLGNMAYRGGSFTWSADSMKTGDNQHAQSLVREEYRRGWQV